jgi:hypothetical protein
LLSSAILWGQHKQENQHPAEQDGAQSWTGPLVDASCKLQTPAEACGATSVTSAFGLVILSGTQLLQFDETGNRAAQVAVRQANTEVAPNATVTGRLEGNELKVDSIRIH